MVAPLTSPNQPVSPQDALPFFSIDGVRVPALDIEVIGGLRDHVHEYSHEDGGDPEKLGRRLYVIRATFNALAKLPLYPGLWPNGLNKLMQSWELGKSFNLIVPDIDKPIIAYAFGWTRKWTWKVRSGVTCTVEFREDSTNLPLPIVTSGASQDSLQQAASNAAAIAAAIVPMDQPVIPNDAAVSAAVFATQQQAALDQLLDIVQSILSIAQNIANISDTVNEYGNQNAGQLQQAIALCQQADQNPIAQDANNALLMRAIRQVWRIAAMDAADIANRNAPLLQWIVPTQMPMTAISANLYGDSTHVQDLLAWNTGQFQDPTAIPAMTVISYYPVPANASTN